MFVSRHILSIFLWLSVSAFTLAGCAGLGKRLEQPRITLSNIQIQEVKAFETALLIELRIFNINDVPIDIKGINCELEINGKQFASGVSNTRTKIPPYETVILPVVVYSSVVKMVKGLLGLKNKDKIEYSLRGGIRVEGGFLVPSVIPFNSSGVLSLEGLTDLK